MLRARPVRRSTRDRTLYLWCPPVEAEHRSGRVTDSKPKMLILSGGVESLFLTRSQVQGRAYSE